MPLHGKANARLVLVEHRGHGLAEVHRADPDAAVVAAVQVVQHLCDALRVLVEAVDAGADQAGRIEIGEGLAQGLLLPAYMSITAWLA